MWRVCHSGEIALRLALSRRLPVLATLTAAQMLSCTLLFDFVSRKRTTLTITATFHSTHACTCCSIIGVPVRRGLQVDAPCIVNMCFREHPVQPSHAPYRYCMHSCVCVAAEATPEAMSVVPVEEVEGEAVCVVCGCVKLSSVYMFSKCPAMFCNSVCELSS